MLNRQKRSKTEAERLQILGDVALKYLRLWREEQKAHRYEGLHTLKQWEQIEEWLEDDEKLTLQLEGEIHRLVRGD